jgi:hypothetical protein
MENHVTSESPTPQVQRWTVARYLRLMGTDLACIRCGTHYHSAKPAGYGIGESPVPCPKCQKELTAPSSPWPDTLVGFVAGAALLLGMVAVWGMVLLAVWGMVLP